MPELNAIANLTVQGQSQGLDKVASDLDRVSTAHDKASAATEKSNRVTESSSRAQLSVAGSYDRLRRSIDPTYRMQQQFARGQDILDRAFQQGVVDAQNYARSLDLLRTKYTGLEAANTNVAKTMGGLSHQTGNIAAQFQDIGVQLAGGQSPFLIALQQGTQLSSVLGSSGGGLRGTLSALAGGFASLISPISLITIGAIAAGGALVHYFMNGGKEVKNLDDKLKEHSELLRDIKARYGDAIQGVEQYGETSKKVLDAQLRASVFSLRDEIKKTNEEFLKSVTYTQRIRSSEGLSRAFTTVQTVDPQYKAFADLIAKFREEAARGEPNIRALRDGVADIMERFRDNAPIQKFGAEILKSSDSAARLDRTLQGANGTMAATGDAALASAAQIKVLDQALSTLRGLGLPDLTETEKATKALREGLAANLPDSAKRQLKNDFIDAQARVAIKETTKALEDMTKAEQNARIQGMEPLQRATEEANVRFRERAKTIEQLKKSGADAAAVSQMEAQSQRILAKEIENASAAEAKRGAKSRDAWEDALTTARARTDQIQEETRLIGQNGAELEANKLRIQLEAEAKKKSIGISEDVRAAIDAEVEARRRAVQEHNASKLMSDLSFERDQMGRSPTEQRVFSQLKAAGLEYTTVAGQMAAAEIRFNESLKETQALAGEALSGFLDDLRNGVSATKALDGALAKIGGRLAQKGLDQLTGGLFGGGSLSIGGLPAANDNRPGGVTTQGFFDGIGDAVKKGFSSLFGGGSLTERPPLEGGFQRAAMASGSAGPSSGGFGLGGLAGGALALAGAYGSGKASGSPLMGGLTGAFSGAMAGSAILPGIGTLIGAVAGGTVGRIGGRLKPVAKPSQSKEKERDRDQHRVAA